MPHIAVYVYLVYDTLQPYKQHATGYHNGYFIAAAAINVIKQKEEKRSWYRAPWQSDELIMPAARYTKRDADYLHKCLKTALDAIRQNSNTYNEITQIAHKLIYNVAECVPSSYCAKSYYGVSRDEKVTILTTTSVA